MADEIFPEGYEIQQGIEVRDSDYDSDGLSEQVITASVEWKEDDRHYSFIVLVDDDESAYLLDADWMEKNKAQRIRIGII